LLKLILVRSLSNSRVTSWDILSNLFERSFIFYFDSLLGAGEQLFLLSTMKPLLQDEHSGRPEGPSKH